ncbi:MAG: flagellar basal-body rod protein FlgF [Rhodospirillales bacterium]
MENTAFIALSRQTALRRQMGMVANNMANMNTTGFKAERMMFVEHLVRSKGGQKYWGDKQAYVRDVASRRDLSEGPIKQTGNPLDLAIAGDGYFVVRTELGDRYTRNGRFQLDQTGQLVTQAGLPVLTDAGVPIFFPPEEADITVARDGVISTQNGVVGRLALARFEDPQNLEQNAGGLYATDDEALPAGDDAGVMQYSLEQSNVQGIVEMTRMMEVHRSYDSVRRFIEREDDRHKKLIKEMIAA